MYRFIIVGESILNLISNPLLKIANPTKFTIVEKIDKQLSKKTELTIGSQVIASMGGRLEQAKSDLEKQSASVAESRKGFRKNINEAVLKNNACEFSPQDKSTNDLNVILSKIKSNFVLDGSLSNSPKAIQGKWASKVRGAESKRKNTPVR
jgi:hypothetical protein